MPLTLFGESKAVLGKELRRLGIAPRGFQTSQDSVPAWVQRCPGRLKRHRACSQTHKRTVASDQRAGPGCGFTLTYVWADKGFNAKAQRETSAQCRVGPVSSQYRSPAVCADGSLPTPVRLCVQSAVNGHV